MIIITEDNPIENIININNTCCRSMCTRPSKRCRTRRRRGELVIAEENSLFLVAFQLVIRVNRYPRNTWLSTRERPDIRLYPAMLPSQGAFEI